MKILIVDDDELQRIFLQRLIRKNFACDVFEAKNGIEGLSIVQQENPDIILLDVMMPIMNGKEFLESLRSETAFQNTPVIVLSAANEKSLVTDLIQLAVTDYLVKPISTPKACDRIAKIIAEMKHRKENKSVKKRNIHAGTKKKLLIVDADIEFRKQLTDLLSSRFAIYESATGVEGLEAFIQEKPDYVCVGGGMRLLKEDALAKKMKAIARNSTTGIYLCSENDRSGEIETGIFDGFITKHNDQNELLKSISFNMLNEKSILHTVFEILNDQIRKNLISLTTQTMGVITGSEISVLEYEHESEIIDDVYIVEELTESNNASIVSIAIVGSSKDILKVSEIILNRTCTLREDAAEALNKIIATIGSGIKLLLEKYGIEFTDQTPRIRINPYDREEVKWNHLVPFRLGEDKTLAVGIVLRKPSE